MNQHTTPTARAASLQAGARQGNDRTHYLTKNEGHGFINTAPEVGHHHTETTVMVYHDGGLDGFPVTVALTNHGFGLQTYLTAAEARTLAQALALAADHADALAEQANQVPA